MRRILFLFVIVISLFHANTSFCGNLYAPFALESTQVLPANIRNPRFLSIHMVMDHKFGEDGQVELLADKLNKQITWDDVLEAQEDQIQKDIVLSVLKDADIPFEGSPGRSTGIVNTYANVNVPVIAIGLTDRLTLGLVIPVYRVDVSVDKGFLTTDDGQKFVDTLCDSSPAKCNEAADKLNNAITKKLDRYGYQALESHTVSSIGDIRLMGKYRLLNNFSLNRMNQIDFSTKLDITFPTGTKPDPDKALNITTGDERFKVGTGWIAALRNRTLLADFTPTVYAGYTALLPHNPTRRLPTSANDSLSKPEWKKEVTRDWGHIVYLGSNLSLPLRSLGLTLTAGYNFQYQSKASYRGNAADTETQTKYKLLEDLEPEQVLHSFVTSIGFSTVDWYQSKNFFLPLQANLIFSHPFAGRNVPNNDVIAGELVLFF